MTDRETRSLFLQHTGISLPVICGPMYPCSNPELVAAASEAGGMGIVQPISLTYVHGYEFSQGLDYISTLTDKPVGMNALIEKTSKKYHQRMVYWIDRALEHGIRFFITSMGKPDWVVEKVHALGGIVYHDATELKWALKGLDCGVDGIIAVNNRAGGHAGNKTPEQLYEELAGLNVPLICAGGVSDRNDYQNMLRLGYSGVQMGTRFIASTECNVPEAYKQAIIEADESDIVLTRRLTGTPVSVIHSDNFSRCGKEPGRLIHWALTQPGIKYLVRSFFYLRSMWQLKRAVKDKRHGQDYWQAGKSVHGIHDIKPVSSIIADLTR